MTESNPEEIEFTATRDLAIRGAQEFRDHAKGMAEWLKNSDDSYIRLNARSFDPVEEIYLVLGRQSVSCVDFGGEPGDRLEDNLFEYGSPEAATQDLDVAEEIAGGHGNGGKYYAIGQFEKTFVYSYFEGKLSKFKITEEKDYKLFVDREMSVEDALEEVGLRAGTEEEKILDKARKSSGFFVWQGKKARDKNRLNKKRPCTKLMEKLKSHIQARRALRKYPVRVVRKGSMFWPDLSPEEVVSDANYPPRRYRLPEEFGDEVIAPDDEELELMYSEERLTGNKKYLNILEITANGNPIAYYHVPELVIDRGAAKYIHATADIPQLKEHGYVSNDRTQLAENPVTNELLDWCKEKINNLIEDVQEEERRATKEENLSRISDFLEEAVDEMGDLLEEDLEKNIPGSGPERDIEVPTGNDGYGGDGSVDDPGGGKRKGGDEETDRGPSKTKPDSDQIQILVSGIDEDPLNPGETYDMYERDSILYQREEDVEHGIWWLNSQKPYIANQDIAENPAGIPFLYFLIKEIIFSKKVETKYKTENILDPATLRETNFTMIDEVFSRVSDRVSRIFTANSKIDRFKDWLEKQDKFTVREAADALDLENKEVHNYINQVSGFEQAFETAKTTRGGTQMNLYVRK